MYEFNRKQLENFLGNENILKVMKELEISKDFSGYIKGIEGSNGEIAVEIRENNQGNYLIKYGMDFLIPIGTVITKENIRRDSIRDVLYDIESYGITLKDDEPLEIIGYEFDISDMSFTEEEQEYNGLTYKLLCGSGKEFFIDKIDIIFDGKDVWF